MKITMALPGIIVLGILLSSCAPQPFTISSTTDKFSDPSAPDQILGINNRLSKKSSHGGVHIDERGVYLNPYALKEKKTGKIIEVGFSVRHLTFTPEDGFRPIEEIIFLTDRGERISVTVIGWDSDFKGWINYRTTSEYNTLFTESGTGVISYDDFSRLAAARSMDVKIRGGKLSQTYGENVIFPEFLPNLRQFRDAMIK